MTQDRKIQLMQEALDNALSPDAEQELFELLQDSPEEQKQYKSQEEVHEFLLNNAVHERAPQRLAMTIMARLAQTVTQSQPQSEITDAMMQTAIQMVTVATLPMLVGAGWMLLNAQTDPKLLEYVMQQVAALLIMVLEVMRVMIEKAEEIYQESPELAMALLTYIPIVMLSLVKHVLSDNDNDDIL